MYSQNFILIFVFANINVFPLAVALLCWHQEGSARVGTHISPFCKSFVMARVVKIKVCSVFWKVNLIESYAEHNK